MAKPQLIGPTARSGPELLSTGGRPTPLPPDLLREASNRLGVMALLGAALWFTGTASYHLVIRAVTEPGDPRWLQFQMMDGIALGCIAMSLGLYWLIRSGDRDPLQVLNLGQVYLVLGALAIGTVWHLDQAQMNWQLQPMITWAGAMVLLFAAIVPAPRGRP